MTFESLALFPRTVDLCRDNTERFIEQVGTQPKPNETLVVTQSRKVLLVFWRFFVVFKVLSILSILLATVLSVVNILHTLSSYRANMSALYRGDHSHIPPASASSNTFHCYNSIRFAGFQVGYVAWGYFVQAIVLILVSLVAAFLIALLVEGFHAWFLDFLSWLWPYALSFALMILVQLLLSKFVFLQERGRYLALDNREVYFNFTFFMFFYNTFIGLLSCLLRILRGLVLGVLLLGRLDFSPLPHKFEFLDPGFRAYVGYMQMEAAHTHPVLIVFCRLLLLLLKEKREGKEKASGTLPQPSSVRSVDHLGLIRTSDSAPRASPFGGLSFDNPTSTDITHTTHTIQTPDPDQAERCRRAGARFRWHMAYTLLRNPDIQGLRKEMLTRLMPAGCVSDCDLRQDDGPSFHGAGEEFA